MRTVHYTTTRLAQMLYDAYVEGQRAGWPRRWRQSLTIRRVTWSELSDEQRRYWVRKAKAALSYSHLSTP